MDRRLRVIGTDDVAASQCSCHPKGLSSCRVPVVGLCTGTDRGCDGFRAAVADESFEE